MEDSMLTIEAFAHFMRGGVTIFFIFWSCKLYSYSRRNRMMKLLFIATLYLTFSFLKDAIFLVNAWKNSEYLDNLVNVVDLVFYPFLCAFFLEAVHPGFATNRRLACAIFVQAFFVVLFLIHSANWVLGLAFALSNVMILFTVITVMLFAYRYQHYIATNYSYHEHIDVVWVAVCCLVYFLTHYLYLYAFDHTTWLSEALYNLYSMVIWTALFLLSQRHKVVVTTNLLTQRGAASYPSVPAGEAGDEADTSAGPTNGIPQEKRENNSTEANRDTLLTERLNQCMENDKPYLIPKLSLGDLATCIGTNKTYLSDFFNNSLHVSFYEYINKYRVEAACKFIYTMAQTNRVNMDEVAEQSGFNSLSSFNRYFLKVKGITPKQYYFSCLHNEEELGIMKKRVQSLRR